MAIALEWGFVPTGVFPDDDYAGNFLRLAGFISVGDSGRTWFLSSFSSAGGDITSITDSDGNAWSLVKKQVVFGNLTQHIWQTTNTRPHVKVNHPPFGLVNEIQITIHGATMDFSGLFALTGATGSSVTSNTTGNTPLSSGTWIATNATCNIPYTNPYAFLWGTIESHNFSPSPSFPTPIEYGQIQSVGTPTTFSIWNGSVPTQGIGNPGPSVTLPQSESLSGIIPGNNASVASNLWTSNDGTITTMHWGLILAAWQPGAANAPSITSLSPSSGTAHGGTSVTITGQWFQGGATVTFNGVAATGITVNSATSITCTTPASADLGSVSVVVTNWDAATASSTYTYTSAAPTVTTAVPNRSKVTGGRFITLTGTDFYNGCGVTFGGVSATSVTRVNQTTVTCRTPAHALGSVDIRLTNTDAQFGTLVNGMLYALIPNNGVSSFFG